jgi:integrase
MAIILRSSSEISYPILSAGAFTATLSVRETGPIDAAKPRLLDRVREAIRTRHYSRRTEKAYVHWIKRYIFFHGKRHPAEMGAAEVTAFLTFLAVEGKVASSTQNQALSALLFLYREVLGVELPWLDDLVRAKRPQHLPVVLTRDEVRAVLQGLDGVPRLMAILLYGAGLRLLECCRLRVKDVDFAMNQITIRDGKGHKDRPTMLPAAVKAELVAHIERGREQHQADLRHGAGWVELPGALMRKSTRTPAGTGAGSGSSGPRASTWTASQASGAATTSTNPCFSGRCKTRSAPPGSPSRPRATPSVTRLPPTCWRRATTSAPFRSCSDTRTSAPR